MGEVEQRQTETERYIEDGRGRESNGQGDEMSIYGNGWNLPSLMETGYQRIDEAR